MNSRSYRYTTRAASRRRSHSVGIKIIILCVILSCACGILFGWLAGSAVSRSEPEKETLEETTHTLTQLPAESESLPSAGASIADVAQLAGPSVVEITTESVQWGQFMQQAVATGAGSGVILSADGYIVTNHHVIDDANSITVKLHNMQSYEARLVGSDPQTDVAVLKIDAQDLTPAAVGNSDELVVGETVVAIGNPLGSLGGTVTDGIISALDRNILIDGQNLNLLQTNAAINPGNSGGGLFDGEGKLIGLVESKTVSEEVEGLGFAIPINTVLEVFDEIREKGYVSGRVDTKMSLLSIDSQEEAMYYRVPRLGLYVYDVQHGSSAKDAGFQTGDCILLADGQQIGTETDLKTVLSAHAVGDQISVTVLRGNQQLSLSWTLEEWMPSDLQGA